MRIDIRRQNRRVARQVARTTAEQLFRMFHEHSENMGPAFRWSTFDVGELAECQVGTSRVWRQARTLGPYAAPFAVRRWRLLCALHGVGGTA